MVRNACFWGLAKADLTIVSSSVVRAFFVCIKELFQLLTSIFSATSFWTLVLSPLQWQLVTLITPCFLGYKDSRITLPSDWNRCSKLSSNLNIKNPPDLQLHRLFVAKWCEILHVLNGYMLVKTEDSLKSCLPVAKYSSKHTGLKWQNCKFLLRSHLLLPMWWTK